MEPADGGLTQSGSSGRHQCVPQANGGLRLEGEARSGELTAALHEREVLDRTGVAADRVDGRLFRGRDRRPPQGHHALRIADAELQGEGLTLSAVANLHGGQTTYLTAERIKCHRRDLRVDVRRAILHHHRGMAPLVHEHAGGVGAAEVYREI